MKGGRHLGLKWGHGVRVQSLAHPGALIDLHEAEASREDNF